MCRRFPWQMISFRILLWEGIEFRNVEQSATVGWLESVWVGVDAEKWSLRRRLPPYVTSLTSLSERVQIVVFLSDL